MQIAPKEVEVQKGIIRWAIGLTCLWLLNSASFSVFSATFSSPLYPFLFPSLLWLFNCPHCPALTLSLRLQ